VPREKKGRREKEVEVGKGETARKTCRVSSFALDKHLVCFSLVTKLVNHG